MVAAMADCTNKIIEATTKRLEKRRTVTSLYLSPELIAKRPCPEAVTLMLYLDCKSRASAPKSMKVSAIA